ncbi:MAG: Ig-like domain-containing protein [Candidatus Omnitrophica bacterium]|nr:Ig-like domain-containing protein [Candidatus Omnitrophota bacterium]
MSLFCLAKCDDFGVWRAIWAQTEAGNAWPNEYRLQRDTGVPLFIRGGSVTQFKSIQVSGARAMKAGEYSVLGVEAAGQNITHFMNGVPNGTGVITVTPEASLVSTPRIGSRDDQVTQMKGDIAELLVFDAAISSQEQDDLANYLMAKYGILLFQVANQRPSVNLTNMATGDTIIPPADLVLTAASEDSDGSVARVDFYANGALLSSVSNAPYQLPVRVEQAAGSVNSRVTFTVVAVDNLGFNATSAPVSLKVASEGASTNMTVTSSLQLWLKADAGVTTNPGGAVTGWADQSGLGYVAAQYEDSIAPVLVPNVINGHPVVRFNGTTQYLDINGAPDLTITGDISIFCVVECDDFDVWRAIWAQTPSGNAAPNEYRIQITSGLPFFIRGGPNDLDTVTATRPLTAGEFAMLGVEAEGQAITHFLNGATNGSGTISVTPVDGGVAPRIGSRNDLVTQMKGDIAELLVYNRALSEAERMSLANYLATKYNLFTDAVVHVIESPAVPELNALRQSDGTVLVTWPESFVDFILESASGFPATDWTSVSGVESNSVTIAPSERSRFYRLRKP